MHYFAVVKAPSKGLSKGAVAGIALGCIAGVLAVILLILFCCRKRIREVIRPEQSFCKINLCSSSYILAPFIFPSLLLWHPHGSASSKPGLEVH